MTIFKYTPYDGSALPFTMGMKPCAEEDWLEVDGRYGEYLSLKNKFLKDPKKSVYQSIDGTHSIEEDALAMIIENLSEFHPDILTKKGDSIHNHKTGEKYKRSDYTASPLKLAGLLVQEDICLLQPTRKGYVLSAAHLSFPSSWALNEKIGQSLDKVHAPVPGYGEKLALKVNFMMNRLPIDKIIWRSNWALDEGPELHRPAPHSHDKWINSGESPLDHVYVRVERQTVRRLKKSNAIIFTIRIYTDLLRTLFMQNNSTELAKGLQLQIKELSKDELAYKGLTTAAPLICSALENAC